MKLVLLVVGIVTLPILLGVGCNGLNGQSQNPVQTVYPGQVVSMANNPVSQWQQIPGNCDEPELEPEFKPNPYSRKDVGKIQFDRNLTDSQYTELAKDLHALTSMALDEPDDLEFRRILGVANSKSLTELLEDRVKIILNPRFGHHPYSPIDRGLHADNYGAGVYAAIPRKRDIRGQPIIVAGSPVFELGPWPFVVIPGLGTKSISSPRAGLIRMGNGFFNKISRVVETRTGQRCNLSHTQALADLTTLTHEGRHSDGNLPNGSQSFIHVKCASGPLAGKYACDRFSNGAYKTGAVFLKGALKKCTHCSPIGKEVLNMLILDAESRVHHDAFAGDPRHEIYGKVQEAE